MTRDDDHLYLLATFHYIGDRRGQLCTTHTFGFDGVTPNHCHNSAFVRLS